MEYRKCGHTIILRLDPGDEIISSLTTLAENENIRTAHVQGLGASNHAKIALFDLEKKMPEVSESLENKKREECAAKGIPYVSPKEQQLAERRQQAEEAEAIRVKELREKCAKKGLDFDTENEKYLKKAAARKAKKEARKAKHNK